MWNASCVHSNVLSARRGPIGNKFSVLLPHSWYDDIILWLKTQQICNCTTSQVTLCQFSENVRCNQIRYNTSLPNKRTLIPDSPGFALVTMTTARGSLGFLIHICKRYICVSVFTEQIRVTEFYWRVRVSSAQLFFLREQKVNSAGLLAMETWNDCCERLIKHN